MASGRRRVSQARSMSRGGGGEWRALAASAGESCGCYDWLSLGRDRGPSQDRGRYGWNGPKAGQVEEREEYPTSGLGGGSGPKEGHGPVGLEVRLPCDNDQQQAPHRPDSLASEGVRRGSSWHYQPWFASFVQFD